jgi:hypothetical protein
MRRFSLLHETISTAATIVIFLQLNEFELPERLKDVLQVLFSDAEMNVAYVKTVEWDRIAVRSGSISRLDLAILLSLGKLDNDWDT